MNVIPIPAFEDNYIWLIGDESAGSYAVVDPGDETPVLNWLRDREAVLSAVMITHQHYDHVGGVDDLVAAFPGIPVYGPSGNRIKGVDHPLVEGQQVSISAGKAAFQVLELPGHTAGHIAYFGEGALFCGDTLFTAGCGRVFDGTIEQLSDSLRRIASLPPATRIYCAHEYTLDNLGFASLVEPDNTEIQQRIRDEEEKRSLGQPTVPSSLSLELATNPFLRTAEPQVIAAAEQYAGHELTGHREVFAALRRWKDQEYD
jgi:hydroxyacylglutathione hydrolase